MNYNRYMQTVPTKHSFLRRAFQPSWVDVVPLVHSGDELPLTHDSARLWGLVLASRHIPHRVRRMAGRDGYSVQVHGWFAERAADEIRFFLEENDAGNQIVYLHDLRPVSGVEPTLVAMALLLLFHMACSRYYPAIGVLPQKWLGLGSANAAEILSGQWWRLATALTLHANGAHVLGNAVIGGVFVWLVCRRLGSGLAWMLTFLGGILGNLLNTLILGAPHNAIGFSTASFAAAGVLTSIAPFAVAGGLHGVGRGGALVSRIFRFIRSALVPLAAGLGLLAMLGAGENTDLGAHLFGFVAGLGFGGIAGFQTSRSGIPGRRFNAFLYVGALAVPVLAWVWGWLAVNA